MNNRKNRSILLFLLLVVFLLNACSSADTSVSPTPEALSWQQQYDLGLRYLSEGNYQEAILAFTAAIEIDPNQAPAYISRGDTYTLAEQYEDAASDFILYIALESQSQEAYIKLSNVYSFLSLDEEIEEILKTGHELIGDEKIISSLKAPEILPIISTWHRPPFLIADDIRYLTFDGDFGNNQTHDWFFSRTEDWACIKRGENLFLINFDGQEFYPTPYKSHTPIWRYIAFEGDIVYLLEKVDDASHPTYAYNMNTKGYNSSDWMDVEDLHWNPKYVWDFTTERTYEISSQAIVFFDRVPNSLSRADYIRLDLGLLLEVEDDMYDMILDYNWDLREPQSSWKSPYLSVEGSTTDEEGRTVSPRCYVKGNELIIPGPFQDATVFSDGIAAVLIDGAWHYIDESGQKITEESFDSGDFPISEGLIAVEKDGKWGYINRSGEVIIEYRYEATRPLYHGLAWVKEDGLWGVADLSQYII